MGEKAAGGGGDGDEKSGISTQKPLVIFVSRKQSEIQDKVYSERKK